MSASSSLSSSAKSIPAAIKERLRKATEIGFIDDTLNLSYR